MAKKPTTIPSSDQPGPAGTAEPLTTTRSKPKASAKPKSKASTTKKATKKRSGKRPPAKKKVSAPDPASEAVPKPKKRTISRTRAAFEIAGESISAGKRRRLELPIGNLMSGTPVALPLIVAHGRRNGPVVWLSAAIHGDEICGVEIIRQVLEGIDNPADMRGTVIAAPVVNVHGFNTNDRYLPDRRDLNRSFPGTKRGSLASRIANLFMTEVVERSDVGIDLHTGADLRTNLPQIRCDMDHAPTLELANVFGAPIVIDARVRDGSLRQAAVEAGKTMLLFEGGEASRFDPPSIAAGKAGVLRTLNHLGLTDVEVSPSAPCLYSRSTRWARASRSGIVHLDARLGELVRAKDRLATIYDPFGKVLGRVNAKYGGIVIGHTQAPLVNRGDAVSHVARIMADPPGAGRKGLGAVDEEEAI